LRRRAGVESWTQIEQFKPGTQSAVATPRGGRNGLDGAVHELEIQYAWGGQDTSVFALAEAIKDKSFELRRAPQRGEGRLIKRRLRRDQNLLRFYATSKPTPNSPVGMTRAPSYPGDPGRAAELDHRRRQPRSFFFWVMGGKKPEEYKGMPILQRSVGTTCSASCTRDRLSAINRAAYEVQRHPDFTTRTRGRDPAAEIGRQAPTEIPGAAARHLVQIRDVDRETSETHFRRARASPRRRRRCGRPRQRHFPGQVQEKKHTIP